MLGYVEAKISLVPGRTNIQSDVNVLSWNANPKDTREIELLSYWQLKSFLFDTYSAADLH